MNDAELTLHVMNRLWLLAKTQGIDEFEYKARAEELLFAYAQMQKLNTPPPPTA